MQHDDSQPSLPTGTPIIEGKRVYISGLPGFKFDTNGCLFLVDGERVDLEYGAAEAITVDNGDVILPDSGLIQLAGMEKLVTDKRREI